MSKIKKVLAMILAMAMVLGSTLTTFAAGDDVVGNSDDRGTIVVKGIEKANLNDVMAYPIALAEYNNNGSFSGYSNLYDIKDLTAPTKEELQRIADIVAEEDGFALDYDADSNTYLKTDKELGMYLIKVPSSDATTYGPAVASIIYTNDGQNANVIQNADLTMRTTVVGPATWVKKNVEVKIDKTVEDVSGTTANIGQDLSYKVVINPVPNYSGEFPKLLVTDTMSAGLTYNGDVKVFVDDVEISTDYYETNFDKGVLTVNFVVDNVYTMNEFAGKAAVIKYTAKLNENAKLNGGENDNTVKLDYTRDSSVEGDDRTEEDKTHTYTFDIDGQTIGNLTENIVTKYGEEVVDGEKQPLKDAEFTLYKDDGTTVYTNETFKGTTTTDINGKIKITGLAAGTYKLKETKAPVGYSLNTHVYDIVIAENINDLTGELKSWTITIDGEHTSTFTMDNGKATETKVEGVEIPNTKLSSLPSTGGIGTTIFTIGGCLIMIVAAGLFFASRRKSAK